MLKTFILTFDPAEMYHLQNEFFAFIQANATTYQFYAPYFGTVFIKSATDIVSLSNTYNSFFAGRHFFIGEIDSLRTAGRQQREIWDWINNPTPPPIPYKPLGPN